MIVGKVEFGPSKSEAEDDRLARAWGLLGKQLGRFYSSAVTAGIPKEDALYLVNELIERLFNRKPDASADLFKNLTDSEKN
jgi:hypothetical protein